MSAEEQTKMVEVSAEYFQILLLKAEQRDRMVANSTYWFHEHQKLSRESLRYADQMTNPEIKRYQRDLAKRHVVCSHEHYHVLKQAEIELACTCDYCKFSVELVNKSPEAMRRMKEVDSCQRNGEGQ